MRRNLTDRLDARRIGGGGTCFLPDDSDDGEVYVPRSLNSRQTFSLVVLACIAAISFVAVFIGAIETFRAVIGQKPFIPFLVSVTLVMCGVYLLVVARRAVHLIREQAGLR